MFNQYDSNCQKLFFHRIPDDTSTSVKGKSLHENIDKLEKDAANVLRFMASNGLVANPRKTTLMFLNLTKKEEKRYFHQNWQQQHLSDRPCKTPCKVSDMYTLVDS